MFCPRDPHVPFWKWDFLESWNLYKKKNGSFLKKVTRKSNAPSSKNFFFKWLKGSILLVQRLFFFFCWKFFSFFRKDLEILIFSEFFKIYIYIHEQSTSNATWIFRIQRNIETWNFKFNHDVANQMWSEAKLGRLLLLDPLRMLKTWYVWNLIMMKWLGLALGRLEPWLWFLGICLKWLGLTLGGHAPCELLAFHVDHVYTPLLGSSIGFRMI